MDWYTDCKLVKDGDGYVVEIYLNNNSAEFSKEFLSNIEEDPLPLDKRVNKLIKEKFADYKINAVKLLIGSLIVATIPFATNISAQAATPSSSVQAVESSVYLTSLTDTGTVVASKLNVRSGPSTNNSTIHSLWRGNSVKVIGESGNFYKIKLSDGRTGWVSRLYLQLSSVSKRRSSVVATAKSLVGTPYVFGGETPSEGGFDCSGLTQYALKQVSYQLNRVSTDQAKQGISVSWSNLTPGDLVFFSFNNNGIISHVGIYIGNGQMIHSPKAGDTVKITSIATSYWQTRFISARRIIY